VRKYLDKAYAVQDYLKKLDAMPTVGALASECFLYGANTPSPFSSSFWDFSKGLPETAKVHEGRGPV